MTYNVEEIADKVITMVNNNSTWEEVEEAFTDDEVGVMREYYLNSDIPFTNESIDYKAECIYVFMRLMAAESIIDDNVGRALNICEFLSGEFEYTIIGDNLDKLLIKVRRTKGDML